MIPEAMRLRPGPLLMILAALCFSLMLGCVKMARAEMPALEIILWRGAIAAPLTVLIALPGRHFTIKRPRIMALRVACGMGAMLCYYTATRGMALADLTLITRLQPVLIAIGAPMVMGVGERMERGAWGLLAVGVVGCAVLLGPHLSGGGWGLWALGALLFGAAAHIALRMLGKTEDSRAIVVWTQLGVLVLSFTMLIATTGELPGIPPVGLWGWLLGVGCFATCGQLLLTKAYALDRAGVVAAASNISPLWAVIIDLALFATWPTTTALLGGALILTAS
ncbi:MAG: drug/metabolite transporter (DMT)-like permease, partial [Myxococcota bacterium]